MKNTVTLKEYERNEKIENYLSILLELFLLFLLLLSLYVFTYVFFSSSFLCPRLISCLFSKQTELETLCECNDPLILSLLFLAFSFLFDFYLIICLIFCVQIVQVTGITDIVYVNMSTI